MEIKALVEKHWNKNIQHIVLIQSWQCFVNWNCSKGKTKLSCELPNGWGNSQDWS